MFDKFKSFQFFLKFSSSVLTVILGLYIMLSKVILPTVSIYAASQDQFPIINPLSSSVNGPMLSVVHDAKKEDQAFSFTELGYTFRTDDGKQNIIKREDKDIPDMFYLSIPKLDIYDAHVETNSTKLDPAKSLEHYKGSCLPDEPCNAFIYGHSTNKWIKNEYDKGEYHSIFSRLDELKYGDEVLLMYNNKTYKYVVDMITVRNPEDVDPLEQPYPKSLGLHMGSVELFTCTPSGTTKYRLSVVAKLVSVS